MNCASIVTSITCTQLLLGLACRSKCPSFTSIHFIPHETSSWIWWEVYTNADRRHVTITNITKNYIKKTSNQLWNLPCFVKVVFFCCKESTKANFWRTSVGMFFAVFLLYIKWHSNTFCSYWYIKRHNCMWHGSCYI